MRLLTIVEAYVTAAMELAEVEEIEGGVVATIPEFPGLLAYATDVHDCATELYARLQGWIQASLSRGDKLPAIGGIDLNAEADEILKTYSPRAAEPAGEFFEDEAQLEAAFERYRSTTS